MAQRGVKPVPSLEDILLRKGALTRIPADRFKRKSDLTIKLSPVPDEADLPAEVRDFAHDPQNAIGKYIRARLLGIGGMGEVWLAWDRKLKRWVALKLLKRESRQDLLRLKREAQLAGALNHPHIAPVYEVGEAGGRNFIAMQYVKGETLHSVPGHDLRTLVRHIRDAAKAVHAAHRKGIVHRDLKPDNLMVEDAGRGDSEKPHLYVMDFGLAKSTDVDSLVSQTGVVMGTPQYMPPEQALGRIGKWTSEAMSIPSGRFCTRSFMAIHRSLASLERRS